MKKKGLIISTIVMVVVLIASLTTATYAWFNQSGTATVSEITFSVASSSDVKIGVAATNTYKSGAGFTDFYSDGATYTPYSGGVRNGSFTTDDHGTWSGDNNDLGLQVTLPFSAWAPDKAVFSASARVIDTSATLTGTFNPDANYMIKANGNGSLDGTTVKDAVMNTDFLHIGLGAVAGTANVRGFGAWIYIDRTDEKASVGILSGLHVAYRVNNAAWTDVDLYDSYHQGTAVSAMTAPSKPTLTGFGDGATYTYVTDIVPAAGDAALWIPLAKGTYTDAENITYCDTTESGIVQLEIVLYLDGTDSDTITTALKNNSATIKILFLAVNSGQSADPVNP